MDDKRFLKAGTLISAGTLFLWGILLDVAGLALPWPYGAIRRFPNDREAVQVISEQVSENGVYHSGRGVFLAISVWPDLLDKEEATLDQKVILAFVADVFVGLALAFAFLRLNPSSTLHAAGLLGLLGAAAAVATHGHEWNWYGFSVAFTAVRVLGTAVGWALVGLALANFRNLAPNIIRMLGA